MAENSAISWTRHTWNPWIGCSKVSPACDGCYAEAMMDKRYGRVEWGGPGQGAGTRSRTSALTWNDPFRWQRQAEKDGDRPFVFCASLADIFDNQVDPQWRADAFEVMRKTPRLVYLLLTKRPQLIVKLADAAGGLPANCRDRNNGRRPEARRHQSAGYAGGQGRAEAAFHLRLIRAAARPDSHPAGLHAGLGDHRRRDRSRISQGAANASRLVPHAA